MRWRSWILRSLKKHHKKGSIKAVKEKRGKKHEENCVYRSLVCGDVRGQLCGSVRGARKFTRRRAAEGRNNRSTDRQFQLRPRGAKSSGGNDRHLDKSRRYSAYRGQHRQNVQIQSAGYRRKVFVHFQQTRYLRIFLLHSSEDDRQNRGSV